MTTLETDVRSATPEPDPADRDLRYVVVAAVLIVGVVVAVLLFGVQRPPALDPVTPGQAPEPTASLAWSGWDGDGDCVHVLDPSGEAHEVTCDRDGFELIAWDDDGLVLLRWTGSGQRLETIDPDTGEVVATRTVRDPEAAFEREGEFGDTTLYSRWRDGVVTVTEDAPGDPVLWSVDAPESYRVERGAAAPDGSVIAGVDTAGRLLLFDPAGEVAPRVWHDDLPDWGGLVWEGTPLPQLPDAVG
jgi:YD repeat-containing protein